MDGSNEKYVNGVTVSSTFFDFLLDFKNEYIYENEGKQVKETTDVERIRMSPQMAKALADLLGNNVLSYEEQYGEIPSLVKE